MKKRVFVLLISIFVSSASLFAQQHQIIVKVADEKQLPIEGAVVELMEKGKSIRSVISKKNGEAILDQILAGSYEVKASFTGYLE
jgi:hypothetical protein